MRLSVDYMNAIDDGKRVLRCRSAMSLAVKERSHCGVLFMRQHQKAPRATLSPEFKDAVYKRVNIGNPARGARRQTPRASPGLADSDFQRREAAVDDADAPERLAGWAST